MQLFNGHEKGSNAHLPWLNGLSEQHDCDRDHWKQVTVYIS